MTDERPPVQVADPADFARATHANLQDMVKVADAKATSLVAIQTLSLGLTLSSSVKPTAIVFLFVATTTASIGAALDVLRPRFPTFARRPVRSEGLLWISALQNFATDPERYVAKLRGITTDEVLSEFAFENLKIAFLLAKKFAWLRVAVWSLGVSVALFFCLVLSSISERVNT